MHRSRLVVAAAVVVVAVVAGYGIAGAATGPGLSMAQGETDNVICPNALTVSGQSASALTLNCAPDATTTTTVASTTTTIPDTTTTTVPVTTTTVPATTTTTVPSTTTTVPTAGMWQPPANVEFQWEIDHPLSTTSASDMATGQTAYNGDTAPGTNPTVYDIDGILNTASTVSQLHALGDHAVAYIEVGTAGNYYTAADEGQSTTWFAQLQANGDFAGKLAGYPEDLLNINSPSTVAIVEQMIALDHARGFDAFEPDLDETWGNNEGKTSVTITEQNEVTYLTTLSNYAASLGMGMLAKNPDDTGSQAFVNALVPLTVMDLSEQCSQYSSCNLLTPFLSAGKPVVDAEYGLATSKFCASDNNANINGFKFNVNLTGSRTPCR